MKIYISQPQENLLGTLHEGFGMMMSELPQERLLIADCAVSSAEACFELTRFFIFIFFLFSNHNSFPFEILTLFF